MRIVQYIVTVSTVMALVLGINPKKPINEMSNIEKHLKNNQVALDRAVITHKAPSENDPIKIARYSYRIKPASQDSEF